MILYIFFFLCIIGAALWIFFTIKSDYWYSWVGYVFGSLVQLIIAGLIFFFGMGFIYFVGKATADFQRVSEADIPIVALQSRDSVEGSSHGGIFASYGSVNGKRVISYVTKAEDGGIRTATVDASDAVIYEDDSQPRITTVRWEKHNDLWLPGILQTGETYIFHVPEGSLTEGYSVGP